MAINTWSHSKLGLDMVEAWDICWVLLCPIIKYAIIHDHSQAGAGHGRGLGMSTGWYIMPHNNIYAWFCFVLLYYVILYNSFTSTMFAINIYRVLLYFVLFWLDNKFTLDSCDLSMYIFRVASLALGQYNIASEVILRDVDQINFNKIWKKFKLCVCFVGCNITSLWRVIGINTWSHPSRDWTHQRLQINAWCVCQLVSRKASARDSHINTLCFEFFWQNFKKYLQF